MLLIGAILLFVLVSTANLRRSHVALFLLLALVGATSSFVFLVTNLVRKLRREQRETVTVLEATVTSNLAVAKTALAEANALRRATLALTQDLRMDYMLDTLLRSLAELIPYQCARVLLLEAKSRLFVARERLIPEVKGDRAFEPVTVDASEFPLFNEIVMSQKSVILPDTTREHQWRMFPGHATVRSWLCTPLVASRQTLGVLSFGHSEAGQFTEEHLRLGKSLAIPAAVAIQNARLYERAEIYGSELEERLTDLDEAQQALLLAQTDKRHSEEIFRKIFVSNPLAFSITTIDEGRLIDVNTAFELRYGYSRAELIGHTLHELEFWEDVADGAMLLDQLRRDVPVRNMITRLRTKTGESKLTAYSADSIQFHGKACVLAVTADVVSEATGPYN